MKDNYAFVRGTTPVELFEKAETLDDLFGVSRLLADMPPSEMWEYARRGLLDSIFEYIFSYVPEEHRDMETVKEFIQMEYDEKLGDFFDGVAAMGASVPRFCNRYDMYRIQPEEVREAVLTELVYSLGLQKDMQTRRCSVVIKPCIDQPAI